jgi:hypothetical protein
MERTPMAVTMKADRIHVFGVPEIILFEGVPRKTGGIFMVRLLTRSHSPEAQVKTGEAEGEPHHLGTRSCSPRWVIAEDGDVMLTELVSTYAEKQA